MTDSMSTAGGGVGSVPPEWQSDELIQADAALDEALHAMDAEVERSVQLIEQLNQREQPATDDEAAYYRYACLTGPAAQEWTDIEQRVLRGDFTWNDLAAGRCASEPDVAGALHAHLERATAAAQAQPEPAPQPAVHDHDEDDDFFDSTNHWRA